MKVAVYTICKNEEQHVERWLETTKDADIRVAVDTGSTDLTPHRFRMGRVSPHSISIAPFRFDDARNAALALVPPDVDVCISLDMDEVLHPGWRKALESVWQALGPDGEKWAAASAMVSFKYSSTNTFLTNTRVHSRHGWRWKYPYHEGLYPNMTSDKGPMLFNIPTLTIEHLPPAKKTRPDIALHNLAWGLFENPGDTRMLHYYGRELLWRGFYREAAEKFVEYFDRGGDHDRAAVSCYMREAYAALCR